ncbi:MAG: M20/M25/M40 family metallo-hydrolase [Gemmatimonadetes bacterium]|uniref:M20/M25/M40 family metallo-hydrolase n=1 Tax=Candidatus Kutchimonas denitrificans TaxID=3056748 RepID=A0AAE4ZA54_9BACT|nr:M20/M25/M40 family metallo-hydrolase [Gemmatimonadota bacterium]NIR75492.1 M20/M25/M40 family metallo-hydrolase [Candidatus Kutchimonas denitrificans]NIS01806.1 M20/M25/M40 family metallo-hydrolase [Gemmatimonadota bacterium]NIT67587.1 M20/M25/M40 family metallo-hydrolase [Gemmatimonadota bacterium]NIU53461.1 M20/M25/M40 family metallo-hydrolase [Gemmatimonadota bacterium]
MRTDTDGSSQGATASVAIARAWLDDQGPAILQEQIELAAIASPPFKERARGEAVAAKLKSLSAEPRFDEVGNLLAGFPRGATAKDDPPVVIAAHLDTVFGPETRVEIQAAGHRWVGPGITDNARGLAVTLAVIRALFRCAAEPRRPLLFVFTVGEEGPGDLRGVKHLFRPGSTLRSAAAFLAVDGSGLNRIIHRALGSRRFRITVEGAGGHSWSDWGRCNPANAVGRLIAALADLPLPEDPRTTLTVARVGGGTAINAIPTDIWVEIDLRSEDAAAIDRIESRIRELLAAGIAAEGSRSSGSLSAEVEIIGERPAGVVPPTHPLVRAAEAATRAAGASPALVSSSTDANVPISLGIPAIAVGGGGRSGDMHTEHEWFEDSDGATGAVRLLDILIAVAEL